MKLLVKQEFKMQILDQFQLFFYKQFPDSLRQRLIINLQINSDMDFGQSTPKNRKSGPLDLSVLNQTIKYQLKELSSTLGEVSLYIWTSKKALIASYNVSITRSKLLSALQIYQWRHHTQFPIIRTVFVKVNQNTNQSLTTVQLTVYVQHCPIKLSQLYQMSLPQSIYVLKETVLGFERLHTRFGCFQITDSMIGINQKGFCRVWLNQNFGLNNFNKRDMNESKMVQKIINIIQPRTQESKTFKKIISVFRECITFYSLLKRIQAFIKQSKILIPTKFLFASSSSNDVSRLDIRQLSKQTSYEINNPTIPSRLSIRQYKSREIFTDELHSQKKQRLNQSASPYKIKRIGSEKDINVISKLMKVSDLQTAYTGCRNRTPNIETHNASPAKNKIIHQIKTQEKYNFRRPAWVEQHSYTMGDEQTPVKPMEKRKKQLTQSEAIITECIPFKSESERKYSCKIINMKKYISPEKQAITSFTKRLKNKTISSQPQSIESPKRVGKSKRIDQVDQQKFRQQVSGSVLKNNGWVAKVSGLLDIPSNLQTSFHQGMEQNVVNKEVKLQKLNNVGHQQMVTSFIQQNL